MFNCATGFSAPPDTNRTSRFHHREKPRDRPDFCFLQLSILQRPPTESSRSSLHSILSSLIPCSSQLERCNSPGHHALPTFRFSRGFPRYLEPGHPILDPEQCFPGSIDIVGPCHSPLYPNAGAEAGFGGSPASHHGSCPSCFFHRQVATG